MFPSHKDKIYTLLFKCDHRFTVTYFNGEKLLLKSSATATLLHFLTRT